MPSPRSRRPSIASASASIEISHHPLPEVSHADPEPISTREASPPAKARHVMSHDGKCPHCKAIHSRLRHSEPESGGDGSRREYRSCKSCLKPFVVVVHKPPQPTGE